MITSVIGRQFLAAYNAAHGLQLSVAEYFEERFIPLFFEHPKYLMEGGNSKLGNGFGKFKTVTREHRMPPHEWKERIQALLDMIQNNPAGSSPLGYHTVDSEKISSSQVSNVTPNPTSEEAMLSWVGGALGIGVEGGLMILLPSDEILLKIEEGWHEYRDLQSNQASLRPNQINTWNGQWLNRCSESRGQPLTLSPMPSTAFSVDKGVMSIATIAWVKVLSALSKLINKPEKPAIIYVYKLAGKGNTTVGFVPVDLSSFRKIGFFYRRVFGDSEYTNNQQLINEVLGSGFGFERACQAGAIGTYALLPKGLRGLMPATKPGEKTKLPDFSKNDNSLTVTYHVYISWLLAMLNDDTLWSRAEEAADLLVLHRGAGKKLSRGNANAVDEVLQASNRRNFIVALTTVVENAPAETLDQFKGLAQRVDAMPPDNFPYFLTLVRFCYALADRRQAAPAQTSMGI